MRFSSRHPWSVASPSLPPRAPRRRSAAREVERNAQFDDRLRLTLPGQSVPGAAMFAVTGIDGRKSDTTGGRYIYHSPAGEVALQCSRRLLLDLGPRRVGNGREFAMQIIHSGASFERADAECCRRRWIAISAGGRSGQSAVRRPPLQERRRRCEKQVAGDGPAEIQQPVVVARRPADKHVLEHLLDRAGRTAVADEIRAEFSLPRPGRTACCRAESSPPYRSPRSWSARYARKSA